MRPFLLLLVLLPGCALLRGPERPDPLMVAVPGGRFVMGDTTGANVDAALPLHEVEVAPFAMMAWETTFAEFDQFARARGLALPDSGDFGRGARAVVNVTWDEAAAFCDWIGARLPSEAEWEWAARGATAARRYAGTDDSTEVPRFARYADNAEVFATREATRAPSPLGFYDLSGNAWEWIGAYHEFLPHEDGPVEIDLEAIPKRILRGGSFRSPTEQLQTSWRASTLRDIRSDMIGFRCVRPLD